MDVASLGIPSVQEFMDIYCQRMGIPSIPSWDFYVAFALFRFAAIIQGVYKRAISGKKKINIGKNISGSDSTENYQFFTCMIFVGFLV